MGGGLPDEIVRFFRANGGHSLIVKGPPGAGKTKFALQLAYELRDSFTAFYTSPRVSHRSLLAQFPATAPTVLRRQRFRSTPPSPRSVSCATCGSSINVAGNEGPRQETCPACGHTQAYADRTELNRLIGHVQAGGQAPAIPQDLPEIETAYDVVDENLVRSAHLRTLLAFHPIDALDDDYDIRAWRLLVPSRRTWSRTRGRAWSTPWARPMTRNSTRSWMVSSVSRNGPPAVAASGS